MTNKKLKLLTATALMLAAQSVLGALPYADGDLILGFHATGGTGATKSYEVNLGSASQFSGGTPATVNLGGDIAADLATIYGPNWSTRSDVKWGISGVQFAEAGTIPARTLFVSKAAPAVGSQSAPWLRLATGTQNPIVTRVQAVGTAYKNGTVGAVYNVSGNLVAGQAESTNSTKALIQVNTAPNSHASHMVGGTNSNTGSSYLAYINGPLGIEATFASGSYRTALDLYKMETSLVEGPGAFLGSFQLNPAGVLSFSATSAALPTAPTVSVVATALTASETAEKVTVMVTRSGDAATPFSVDVATTAVTAVAVDDFTPVSTTVSFASGEVSKLVDVFLVNAPGYQGSRTFNVALSSPTAQAVLGTASTTVVTITDDEHQPLDTPFASKGAAVPGAGVLNSGIQVGALWTTFGVPAINDAGQVAFLGSWSAPAVKAILAVPPLPAVPGLPAQLGSGIFATGGLVVKTGAPAPGIENAVMSALSAPLLGPDGSVAWKATLANAKGTTGAVVIANNSAIFLDEDGAGPSPAILVARKGGIATEEGTQWSGFPSVSLGANSVAFTATLVNRTPGVPASPGVPATPSTSPGPGGTTTLTDSGLWIYDRSTQETVVALREGNTLLGSTVKIIAALAERPGSLGQGRGTAYDGADDVVAVRVTLSDPVTKIERHALGVIAQDGVGSFNYVAAGNAVGYPGTTDAKWLSFGLPTQNNTALAFLGTVKALTGSATALNNVAIFAEDDATQTAAAIVKKGDTAPGVVGGVFSVLNNPVNAANRGVAFLATMKTVPGITAADNDGIWKSDGTNGLSLVAREGAQPAETAVGAKWKTFTSIALPEGRGPLFVASLINRTGLTVPAVAGPGGITPANDVGLWATDSAGALRLLLQEGDVIGTSTVKTFTVLPSVLGSPAQARSFNNAGKVIVRITDAANAQHLLQIAIP